MAIGRPSKYTPELFREICERLSIGEPLAQICRDDKMPDPATVWRWMKDNEPLSQSIARAREDGEEVLAAECLGIADDGRNDWMEKLDSEGQSVGWQLNGEHVQRSKLRIETRLKLLAKWNPKKYGEKQAIEHGGPGGKPIPVIISSVLDE